MDKTVVCSNSRNTIRTDLSLLLDCLKFQMKCPDLQKQALLTIHSICENREDTVDMLREMGGVAFVYSLSKSSIIHSDVKETALFTLGTIAEANVYCKNSLCRKETFAEIAGWLMKEDVPLTQKRVSVYLLSVLVANNKSGQTLAQTTGCLDILLVLFRTTFPLSTEATLRAANATQTYQLWASVSSALCGCVNNPQNGSLASGLAQYGVVFHLVSMLASPHLETEDRLAVLLTMGHCTEASEEHQSQLVQGGGLPLIITLLTEDTSEEIRKAATFILQTSKQATMSLRMPGLIARQKEGENFEPLTNMEGFRDSARELLHRNDLPEKRQTKEDKSEWKDTDPSASIEEPSVEAGDDSIIKIHTVRNMTKDDNDNVPRNVSSSLSMQEEKAKTSGGDVWCSVCKGTGTLMSSHLQSLEGGRELLTADNQLFKPPAPVKHSVPKAIKCTDETGLQCREMRKVRKIPVEEHSLSHIRCAGCVLSFEEVTSRSFTSLQSSCHHSCDMHKVLQEATERFRTRHWNLLFRRENQGNTMEQAAPGSVTVSAAEPHRGYKNWSEVCLSPVCKGAWKGKSSLPEHQLKKHNGFTLTPLRRGAKKDMSTSYHMADPGLTPLKRSHLPEERRGGNNGGHRALDGESKTSTDHFSTRRKRNDFSREEVQYLLSGVKTYGFSWNSILWSYPFKPGRTNVGLAKKYRQLMKSNSGAEILGQPLENGPL
uniref:telomere repeats-binding bouquet formation protein 1 isoform X10 n=1 Tax=Scatophagus argus TaxID=75038 RepID=UPI001ED858A9|nr:telomere repeats-binding bouquet formation protein 1 isoform X10 [Scatophagus argus]